MSIESSAGPAAHPRPARDDVRVAVVQAAGELFTRRGYTATTLDEIAQAAGFTKGAIYSDFGGKPELFAAAMAAQLDIQQGTAIQAAARLSAGQSVELARQLARLVVTGTWSPLMSEFRVVAHRDPAAAHVYADLRRRAQVDLADRLRTHAESLHLAPGLDHDAAAVLLLTLIAGLGDEHALAPDVTTPAVIESALRQVIGGLLR